MMENESRQCYFPYQNTTSVVSVNVAASDGVTSASGMSQNSIFSDVSSIPPSIIDQDDEEFNEELCHVNNLYFGNLVQVNDISVDCEIAGVSDESDNEGHEESDQELGDKENCEFEVCDSDNREFHYVQNFLHNTCGCTRLYGKPMQLAQ